MLRAGTIALTLELWPGLFRVSVNMGVFLLPRLHAAASHSLAGSARTCSIIDVRRPAKANSAAVLFTVAGTQPEFDQHKHQR